MDSIKLSWTDFKAAITARAIPIHETVIGPNYHLQAFDGPLARECVLVESADKTDYTTNYQAAANPTYTDSNGVALSRVKITEAGWHYQVHGIEATTSLLTGGYNKDITGTDLGFLTVKFYDSGDTELTTQPDLDSSCVKTIVEWEPDETFGIIGGTLFQAIAPTTDVRMWVTAVPDLTVAQGGSVPFAQGGVNLKLLGDNQSLHLDGKTAKKLTYIPGYGTTKFRIILLHGAGVQCPLHLLFDIFRENV